MMGIVFAPWVKATAKWALVALVVGLLGWVLMWGVGELLKPCPNCQGRPMTCAACAGSGKCTVTKTCPNCNGSGRSWGKCSGCNGNRTISYEVTCEACKGYKTIECPKCHK